MKKTCSFLFFIFGIISINIAQINESDVSYANDSVFVDSINSKNLVGLNVFPAFGILGGGHLPSTKVFLQYKHYYDNMNLRASINYLSFDLNNDKLDILGTTKDTLIENNDTSIVNNMLFRKFYYDVYSYDIRFGLEAAFSNKGYRFYLGSGLILGYHYLGEYFYHYKKEFEGFPSLDVNNVFIPANIEGFRKTQFLKIGLDFTVGVDIYVSPNFVISVQYAPELVYYNKLKEYNRDPDNYYHGKTVPSSLNFVPDYIDLVFNIRF